MAFINAFALFTVSVNSFSGLLSATIPAPACTKNLLSLINAVLKAIQVSNSSLGVKYPIPPAYKFLLLFSNSSIISIALIFGAPLTVPAGKTYLKLNNEQKAIELFKLGVTLDRPFKREERAYQGMKSYLEKL